MANGKPGRPKGLRKTGGRAAGSPNKETLSRAAQTIESVKITVERVLQEYGCIAFVDIAQAFREDGSLKPIHEIPEDIRRAIAGIEVVNYEEDGDGKGPIGKLHKIKIIEKTKALDSIGKHLGMFIERLAGADGGPIQSTHTLKFIDPPSKKTIPLPPSED